MAEKIDWESHEAATARAVERALASAIEKIPTLELIPERLKNLTGLMEYQYRVTRKRLHDLSQESALSAIKIAAGEAWFSYFFEQYYRTEAGRDPQAKLKYHAGLCDALFDGIRNHQHLAERENLYIESSYTAPLDAEIACLSFATFCFLEADRRLNFGAFDLATEDIHSAYSILGKLAVLQAQSPVSLEQASVDSQKAFSKAGAQARHAENRAMKREVFLWCDENMIHASSMDTAASKVAGTIVPAAWRTVRDWMTEWKRLRSAGTA